MNDKFMKMMEKKKKDGPLSDVEKHAKMSVVKSLSDMASDMMGDKLKGLKKVSVASDSDEGLAHGLDKAKEILSQHEDADMKDDAESGDDRGDSLLSGDGSEDEDNEEPSESEHGEDELPHAFDDKESPEEEEDEEALDKKLQELMAKKAKLKKK